MAENKATALNQAYKIKLILRDEERPHLIDEYSSVVLDITDIVKAKGIGTTDMGGDSPANRIIGVQEVYDEDFPGGYIAPLFHGWGLNDLRKKIGDIVRASIVNEKQYEAVMRMIERAFRDEADRRESQCRDIIKSST